MSLQRLSVLPEFVSRIDRECSADWSYCLNLVNLRRVAIFGAGHCGVALAETMLRLGYAVSLVDPRGDSVFTWKTVPEGVRRIGEHFSAAASKVNFVEQTEVIVMTHSFPTDVEALAAILRRPFRSVGVMGSAPKVSRIKKSLKDLGFNDLQISRVRAPVGLPFDSDTPEEIAISVAAQILLKRDRRN